MNTDDDLRKMSYEQLMEEVKSLREYRDASTGLTELHLKNGGMFAELGEGDLKLILAELMYSLYELAGGPNYTEIEIQPKVEVTVSSPEHADIGPLTITIQRHYGRTPHALRLEAQDALAEAKAEIERLKRERTTRPKRLKKGTEEPA